VIWTVIKDDMRDTLSMLAPESVDSIVCDPPYGLSKEPDIVEVLEHWLRGDDYKHGSSGFMGKSWDSFVPGPSYWRVCYEVLKPGGYLIAFGGTRTYDLMIIAIRMAGSRSATNLRGSMVRASRSRTTSRRRSIRLVVRRLNNRQPY
jgi:DNA modification methylase